MAGYERTTRDQYLKERSAAGLIDRTEEDRIVATPAGIASLGDSYEPLPTGSALCEHWLRNVPRGDATVVRIVVQALSGSRRPRNAREAAGYKRTTRDQYIKQLAARELVETSREGVRASALLFH